MCMSQERGYGRRTVLQSIGGTAAASVLGGTAIAPALAAHDDEGTGVRVDQIGYPTGERKVATITDEFVDDIDAVTSFEVQDAKTGETVFTEADGSLSGAFDDVSPGSGQRVRHANFTDLTTPGEYVLVAGGERSRPFSIGSTSELYGDLLVNVGRLYTLHRANAQIRDPITGLEIGPGHVGPGQDPEATIAEGAEGDFLADYGITSVEHGDAMDVTGGWYDAGDYGKYVVNLAPTVAQVLLAYERDPEMWGVGDFRFPPTVFAKDPNVGEMPDILVEAKHGIRFLENMQVEEGALFFKVAAKGWPAMDEAPREDDRQRFVFGLSSAATAMGAAVFAQAARIYRGIDDEFAARMEVRAENAFSWLAEQRGDETIWETSVEQDSGSGAYSRSPSTYPDDPARYWAAAELLRLTGEEKYEEYVQRVGLTNDGLQPVDWNNTISLAHYAYYKADGANRGDVAGSWGAAWNGLHWTAGQIFTDPAYPDGLFDYYWGALKSGVSRGTQLLMAKDLGDAFGEGSPSGSGDWSGDYDLALEPLHHVLGRSATGYSYVAKYGERSTEHPHSRIARSQGILPPGMLVGGPHNTDDIWNSPADTTSAHVSRDTPASMTYLDEFESFATNEWAINYTAPLFLLLAGAVDEIEGNGRGHGYGRGKNGRDSSEDDSDGGE